MRLSAREVGSAGGQPPAEEPTTATSQPRVPAVDALRALALLGILSVNVWYFVYPEMLQTGMRSTPVESGADQLVRFVSTVVFEGKSYVVFSFLFGLAFVLAWSSAARASVSVVRRSVRRFAALLILGVLHGVFLFVGDILVAYAVLGFALLGMRRISTRWAVIIAVTLLALWAGLVLVAGLLTSAVEGTELWEAGTAPVGDPDAARAAYSGGVGSYLGFQLSAYPTVLAGVVFGQGPMALAAFLLGLVVGRARLLERIVAGEVPTAKLLMWMLPALALGLTLSAAAAVMLWGPPGSTVPASATSAEGMGAELTAMGLVFLAGPIQATGYVLLALLVFRAPAAAPLVTVLAAAGRMSLTNYLGQSVVLTLIFSGVGLGLAGQLSAVAVAGVVLGLWAAQVVLSRWWFTRFDRGPVEAPLRAWTYS